MSATEAPTHRGRGRPAQGVKVEVRISADVLTEIDRRAVAGGATRAAMIRRILTEALDLA